MELSGVQTIAVSIEKTWAYLADVRKVALCVPKLQDIEEVESGRWQGRVVVQAGLIKAKFGLTLTRPEVHAPDRMTMVLHGKASGTTVAFTCNFALSASAEHQTEMRWQAQIKLDGALAGIGTRIIETQGEKMAQDFFTCLKARIVQEYGEKQ